MKTSTRIAFFLLLLAVNSLLCQGQLRYAETSDLPGISSFIHANQASEVDPNALPDARQTGNQEAIWDIQFAFPLDTILGTVGLAGAETNGTYFLATHWGSAGTKNIYRLTMAGVFVDSIVPTWITTSTSGLRDLAWDGYYFYGSDVTTTIYCFNQSGTLINTITSPVATRAIAYDNVNDAFWVNNFSTTLTLVSRTGTTLNTITTPPSMYGCAYDNVTPGGPFLWIFTGTSTGGGCQIQKYVIATKTLTTVNHSVSGDFGAASIAGGLFSHPNIVPGKYTVGGLAQGSLKLFGYEVGSTGTLPPNDLGVSAIVSPVSGILTNAEQVKVSINNFGTAAQSNFTVSYKVGTGTTVTETVTASVASGATYDHTFAQTVDMSASGATYLIKAWTNLTSDTVHSNDTMTKSVTNYSTTTPWGIQFQYPAATTTGGIGLAGAEWNGTHFFVAEWGSAGNRKVFKLNVNGTLAGQFTPTWIPGTSGLRDLAFDGLYLYGSDVTNTIYCFDATGNIVNTITSPVAVRAIAYDELSDAFWVNNFSTDITLVSRAGAILNVIGTPPSIYGLAYDNVTSNGPYLWLFSGTTSGAGCQVEQFKISTGTATGVTHSVSGDFGAAAIAGGLFSATDIVQGTFTLGGLAQSTQILFGYFIDMVTGKPYQPVQEISLEVYPNPVSDQLFIRSDQSLTRVELYNQQGQRLLLRDVTGQQASLDVQKLSSGVYFVRIETAKGNITKKISLH